MDEQTALLELNEKNDMLAVTVKCPTHGGKYTTHVAYVNVSCNRCGISYRTEFDMSIYDKVARKLNSLLRKYNEVIITATEKYADDLICIQYDFKGMKCWRVSDIEDITTEYKRCRKCGTCHNCFTCKSCGMSFAPDTNRRKQKCPHCQSSQFTKTYFKEVLQKDENKEIKLCPFCKSDDITMSRTKHKTKCEHCGTTKLSEPRIQRDFKLIIRSIPGYAKDN